MRKQFSVHHSGNVNMIGDTSQWGPIWDSAKKPIKVRSVLQRNGMRHFVVNEESDEIYNSFLLQQKQRQLGNKPTRPSNNDGATIPGHQQHHHSSERSVINGGWVVAKNPLRRSHTFNELDERSLSAESTCVLGIAGSKICNSKVHKGHYYFHQLQQPLHLMQLQKENLEMNRCPRLRSEVLDLIPVKSPVIKKLINATSSKGYNNTAEDGKSNSGSSKHSGGVPSTTLCSRIMTWIDLEVKRNTEKGKPLGKLPFTSADLNIVNDLTLPSYDLTSTSSASDTSSASSSSGDGINTSCSSSCNGSSEISLPQLVPCWRKEKDGAGNKVKKSVRIADDLPHWGKMKRRVRVKERSFSLNELCNEGEQSISQQKTERVGSSSSCHRKSKNASSPSRKYSSALELKTEQTSLKVKETPFWSPEERTAENTTDNFFVCDERLSTSSGKLQVHIFLPQTDSSRTRVGIGGSGNSYNLGGRSEDSTSSS